MTPLPVADVDPLFAATRRHLTPGQALASRLAGGGALEHVAQGATVTRTDGRDLIDFGSYGVALLGHRHPAVVAAVSAELERMPASTRSLGNPTTIQFASELVDAIGSPPLQRVWMGGSGADAVDAAVKLARLATGNARVLTVERAFHGKTLGVSPFTDAAPRAGVHDAVAHGSVQRLDPADPAAVAAALATGPAACLLVEPVQGEGGARALDPAILRRWAADARAAGVFVLADEVQCGLWRCGALSVAVHDGIAVDAVLLGKALGGGVMPLSAVVGSDALFAPLLSDPFAHTSTFGGHPLACAAGRAALAVLAELAPRVPDLIARVDVAIEALADRHRAVIGDRTGRGLLRGVELRGPEVAGEVLMQAVEDGLVLSPCLSQPQVLRLLPPLVTTDEELEQGFAILDRACAIAGRTLGLNDLENSCPSS